MLDPRYSLFCDLVLARALLIVGGVVLNRIFFELAQLFLHLVHLLPRTFPFLCQSVASVDGLATLTGEHSDRVLLLLQKSAVLLAKGLENLRVAFLSLSHVLVQLRLERGDSFEKIFFLH